MRRALIIFSVTAVILVGIFGGLIQWIDKKPWISYLNNRIAIKVVARVYEVDPFASKDDSIARTLKIAHFIALSKIDRKPLSEMLLDFYEAQELIRKFIQENASSLDDDAIAELTLERLSILNRMNAVLIQSNRPPKIDLESVRSSANAAQENASDEEIKSALSNEIHLYDSNRQEEFMDEERFKSDKIFSIDAYHYGLASCARGEEFGAQLIDLGLENISRAQLIGLTMRDIDHPLIAAASAESRSACSTAVEKIRKKVRG